MVRNRERWASAHVLWDELACHSVPPVPYPLDLRSTVLPRLLAAFEAIRALWGVPLRITSAYRTPAHNAAIKGSPGSQHCQGAAVDFEPPADVPASLCYRRIVALRESRPDLGIGYVCGYAPQPGKPRGQLHIDVGPHRGVEWKEHA